MFYKHANNIIVVRNKKYLKPSNITNVLCKNFIYSSSSPCLISPCTLEAMFLNAGIVFLMYILEVRSANISATDILIFTVLVISTVNQGKPIQKLIIDHAKLILI